LKKDFAFCIDDIGAGWEYIRFELGGKTVSSFRASYIGPGVRSFVDEVANMKEKENKEFVFLDEPGQHTVFLSRRRDNIYIELPGMDEGFFIRYNAFADKIMEEYRKYYS
jgi:hypothetical protein